MATICSFLPYTAESWYPQIDANFAATGGFLSAVAAFFFLFRNWPYGWIWRLFSFRVILAGMAGAFAGAGIHYLIYRACGF